MFGGSLSARVLWLTIGIILFVELITLMPSLGRERQDWLLERVTQAHLAAYSAMAADAAGKTGMLDEQTRAALLTLSDTASIRLVVPGKIFQLPPIGPVVAPDRRIDLATESLPASMWQADRAVVGLGGRWLEVVGPSPLQSQMMVDIVVSGKALMRHLRAYVANVAGVAVILAVLTGFLVFSAMDRLLVRPMQILTASIVGFRRDPEHAEQNDLSWLAARRDDEISSAARELAEMQVELRAALWRNARLAALGTAVAKISHDLRNILSSALLVADQLQETADPAAKRAARTLIPSVERAAALVSNTVDFAREGPPAIVRGAVCLVELIDEAALALQPHNPNIAIENQVPASLVLALDRTQIYRVLVNLLRNAAEAGASRVTLLVEIEEGATRLILADNGPGLPKRVKDNLFRPFNGAGRRGGSGLGLVIARDLIRAHGGDLVVRRTGSGGATFAMDLALDGLNDAAVPKPYASNPI